MTGPSERGITTCRGCGAAALSTLLDLGHMPIANELPPAPAQQAERFPLHLRICRDCCLGQVGEVVPRERLFSDSYPYFSGTSSTWAAHCRSLVGQLVQDLSLRAGELCVEIASNDGTLLKFAADFGLAVLGIEPAQSVADHARRRGVRTIQEFFGSMTAKHVRELYGAPRVIVANNVMAHVPDLHDFLLGLAALSAPHTVITVENPDLLTMLKEGYFDTIYHEHYSYLSTRAVVRAAAQAGLEVIRVEELPTHGGSLRWWMALTGSRQADPSVREALQREDAGGLDSQVLHASFSARAANVIDDLRAWLAECQEEGARVAGYGAAAKGMTLLGAICATEADLAYVVDASPAKQGRFVPGTGIPILPPEHLLEDPPDRVLILPWNLASEIGQYLDAVVPSASAWTAVPAVARVGRRS